MNRLRLPALLLALLATQAGFAHDDQTIPPQIVVNGQGTTSAPADTAEIEIGVVTQARDAAEASRKNAARMEAVLSAIHTALPRHTRVQTARLSIRPDYLHHENRKPTISGYTATNTVRIETQDLDGVSRAIDQSMSAGANNVQSLRFKVKDENLLRATALKHAISDARSQAAAIADALGVKITGVRSVHADRGGPAIRHAERAMMMSRSADVATPVESGEIDLHASVNVTYDISQ